MKCAVKTLDNKAAGDVELDDSVFALPKREDILHRVVNWQLAKRRAGTHKTKGISEIAATGKKPWRQKGTGNARAGSKVRPQDRGGMTVFGPLPRDHGFDLPKKIRLLGLKTALSVKAQNGTLIVLDKAGAKSHKTKEMAAKLKALGAENALIIGGEELDVNFARSCRNLPHIDVLPSQGANVYDILRRDTLVLTQEAVQKLTERLKG